MCGICGLIYRDSQNRPSAAILRRMAATLRHRGPDDEGVEIHENVGLAHRRLSIIDLSPAGHQPMANEDGTVWVVFNGEIYNFKELRRSLEGTHRFRSNTDTEVLVHLYEAHGPEMVHHLDGMFAFVIADLKQRRVFLARDPFGIKPLYFSLNQERLVFGSELKPLLASGQVSRQIDRGALNDYFDFFWIPAPRTIFADVRKLPPAHTLLLDLRTWETQSSRYWRSEYRPEYGKSIDQWLDEVEFELGSAVQRQLVSDVPLGTFLSGGIDSTLISHYASENSRDPIKTFTIDFEDRDASESAKARLVADQLKTDAVFRTVTETSLDTLDELAYFFDEPFADSSLLPTSVVSKVARQAVTVVLSGDGGDELFSGYRYHDLALKISQLDSIPPAICRWVFGPVGWLAPKWSRFGQWGRHLAMVPHERRLAFVRLPGKGERTAVLSSELREPLEARRWFLDKHLDELRHLPPVTQVQMYELLFYLPSDMLVKVDRASMACGLEARVPFLTRTVAELAFRIPESIRYDDRWSKPILRRAVARRFNDQLATAPKHGFSIPRGRWMASAAAQKVEREILQGEAVKSGCLDEAEVRRLFTAVRRGPRRWALDRSPELFALMMFHHWWNQHMRSCVPSVGHTSSEGGAASAPLGHFPVTPPV